MNKEYDNESHNSDKSTSSTNQLLPQNKNRALQEREWGGGIITLRGKKLTKQVHTTV